MDQWVRANFTVVPNGWNDGQGHVSDAFTFKVGGQDVTASIAWFDSKFGGVATPPTAAALKAVDPANATGWSAYFDAWKGSGLIA